MPGSRPPRLSHRLVCTLYFLGLGILIGNVAESSAAKFLGSGSPGDPAPDHDSRTLMRCTEIGKIDHDRRGKIMEALEERLAAGLQRELKQVCVLLNRAHMTAAPFTPKSFLLNSATATSHATRSTARACGSGPCHALGYTQPN